MSRTSSVRLLGSLLASGGIALLPSSCKVWPGPGEISDVGPRVGFELQVGWQEMSDGVNQDGVAVYDDSALASVLSLFSFAWGMESGAVYFEPALYAGGGSGRIDNGRLIGIADAEFDSSGGGALGAGFKSRIALADTRLRVGLDARYVQFKGESDFKVDGLPALTNTFDATTRHLEVLAVLDYNDPHYRPFLGAGFFGFFTEFEDQDIPASTIEIDPENPFGVKGGIEFHHIGDTGFYGIVDLGYFGGGPMFGLGLGYRF